MTVRKDVESNLVPSPVRYFADGVERNSFGCQFWRLVGDFQATGLITAYQYRQQHLKWISNNISPLIKPVDVNEIINNYIDYA